MMSSLSLSVSFLSFAVSLSSALQSTITVLPDAGDQFLYLTRPRHLNIPRVNASRVVIPQTAAGVVAAVQQALDEGKSVSVLSGYHEYVALTSPQEGGILVSMVSMTNIQRMTDDGFSLLSLRHGLLPS
jgi:FAD/FMN-containing dehydrogenase